MARKTSITGRSIVIPASALQVPTRPNYFPGKLLSAEDFRLEQQYLNGKRQLHNLATLGAGVVTGLAVSEEPGDTGIKVSAGYAIDGLGREIIVPEDVCVAWPTANLRPPRRWGVMLEYDEQEADPLPTTDGPAAGTVTEGYRVTVVTERPAPDDQRVVLRRYRLVTKGRSRSG